MRYCGVGEGNWGQCIDFCSFHLDADTPGGEPLAGLCTLVGISGPGPPAIDYVVHHAGGSTPVTVDQRFSGGRWYSLGEFDMAPGQNHRVSLSAVVGERTVADGVRFVPVVGARVVHRRMR